MFSYVLLYNYEFAGFFESCQEISKLCNSRDSGVGVCAVIHFSPADLI
jgi:hypothetical protein